MKLLEADRSRAEGRGARGRSPRDGESRRGPQDRREVRPRHEPAADGLCPEGRGAAQKRDGSLKRTLDEIARSRYGAPTGVRAEPRRIRPHADHGGSPWSGVDRPRGAVDRDQVQAARRRSIRCRLVKVVHEWPGATLGAAGLAEAGPGGAERRQLPPVTRSQAEPSPARPVGGSRPVHPSSPWVKTPEGRLKHVPSTSQPVSRLPPGARGPEGRGDRGQSWWTARATSGEVTPGFTEGRRSAGETTSTDPRAEGGDARVASNASPAGVETALAVSWRPARVGDIDLQGIAMMKNRFVASCCRGRDVLAVTVRHLPLRGPKSWSRCWSRSTAT